ncbi:uncharacterized protein LOC126736999 [Anthonomus grandis grandis]|uniref:uncharacterized protein LOC126736999 n=1 Tax=Anthonomus grandis grandis TaxID=2921223 RepID=UPI0021661A96|nr:uncharacterized protein LOC126736999 [Anthonomus grandis grandis]
MLLLFLLRNMLVLLVLLIVATVAKAEATNCDSKGILVYEDIGCKPVFKDNNQQCPYKFDCVFAQPKSPGACLFKGRTYKSGEHIDSNLTYSGCSVGCFCTEGFIHCAVLDCPEYFGGLLQGCYHSYELGQCCSTGTICEEKEKTCEVDGEIYKIGQPFYPKDTCLKCVCHEGFIKGQYDEKTCMKQNCNIQVNYPLNTIQKCAPAYFKFDETTRNALCCPNEFICPDEEESHEVITVEDSSDLKCTYGNKTLQLGQGFMKKIEKYGKERKLKCECVLPPLLTCKEE